MEIGHYQKRVFINIFDAHPILGRDASSRLWSPRLGPCRSATTCRARTKTCGDAAHALASAWSVPPAHRSDLRTQRVGKNSRARTQADSRASLGRGRCTARGSRPCRVGRVGAGMTELTKGGRTGVGETWRGGGKERDGRRGTTWTLRRVPDRSPS